MPEFIVVVTRNTTESAFVPVTAATKEEARAKIEAELPASEHHLFGPDYFYERDECATSDPYITSVEEN